MIRKALSLLLALSVMLTHLAAAPHLHGAEEVSKPSNDTRPHLHLSQFGFAVQTAPVKPVPQDKSPFDRPADHDADAWYLSDPGLSSDTFNPTDTHAAQAENSFATLHLVFELIEQPAFSPVQKPPPANCPLFVRHLALLI